MEDDQDVREMLVRTLDKSSWNTKIAKNGREALESLKEAIPQLILLDLMMPEMDGFEFIAEMKTVVEWQDIPVVVLTAKDLSNKERQTLSGHVEQIIEKQSYSSDELVQEIRNMIVAHIQQKPDEEEFDG